MEPGCTALVTKYGDIRIQIGHDKPHKIGTELDTIQLSIFSHRFMSTAEQMGRYVIIHATIGLVESEPLILQTCIKYNHVWPFL